MQSEASATNPDIPPQAVDPIGYYGAQVATHEDREAFARQAEQELAGGVVSLRNSSSGAGLLSSHPSASPASAESEVPTTPNAEAPSQAPVDTLALDILRRNVVPGFITHETALDLFSYADVKPGGAGETNNPNALLYADELVAMYGEVGGEKLLGLADRLVDACTTTLAAVGVEGSEYARSRTWALWDLAKQRYIARHPAAQDSAYMWRYLAVGGRVDNFQDPLESPEKLWDIVDRQLGWEMQREMHRALPEGASRFSGALQNSERFPIIQDMVLNGEKNDTNLAANAGGELWALRSFALSQIGEQVRLAALDIQTGRNLEAEQEFERLRRHESWVSATLEHGNKQERDRDQAALAEAPPLQEKAQQEIEDASRRRAGLLARLHAVNLWSEPDTDPAIITKAFLSSGRFNTQIMHLLVRGHNARYQSSGDPFQALEIALKNRTWDSSDDRAVAHVLGRVFSLAAPKDLLNR